jgi:hypothetical protein
MSDLGNQDFLPQKAERTQRKTLFSVSSMAIKKTRRSNGESI